jgi:hypothetical protein
MPDVVVPGPERPRKVISLKWGMRHDRMYEVGYEAYAIKDWCNTAKLSRMKVFLVTNDETSGYKSRLGIMLKVPAIDGVYHVTQSSLPAELQKNVKSLPELLKEVREVS